MKSLFAKILVAQVVAVVLALFMVMLITRVSLDRGFISFLERQEVAILDHLAPALGKLYEDRGGWAFLRDHPENWQRILHRTRHYPGGPVGGDHTPLRPRAVRPGQGGAMPPPEAEERLRWLRSMDRLQLRDRLFVLDENRALVAGASTDVERQPALQAVEADGEIVGWIGFTPVRRDLPPEAHRFMRGQLRAHLIALLAALGMVGILGYMLARHLSRPVRQLDDTVRELSLGQFDRRADVSSADEIGRLAANVNRLAETLQNNRSARHRWMTDIAHELRTPVAILKGEIEALGDGLRQPDAKTIASLGEEINHLSVLVDDLQSLALADAGALTLNQELEDLRGIIESVCSAFGERLAARGISLEIDPSDPVTVSVDALRVRQLIGNLLENCVRYSRENGQVRVSLAAHPAAAEVVVEDSGPGVAPSRLEKLFERFYRGEESKSRRGGGSGLGLAICRSIAEAHGGRIWAAPSSMGGLAIHFTLPR